HRGRRAAPACARRGARGVRARKRAPSNRLQKTLERMEIDGPRRGISQAEYAARLLLQTDEASTTVPMTQSGKSAGQALGQLNNLSRRLVRNHWNDWSLFAAFASPFGATMRAVLLVSVTALALVAGSPARSDTNVSGAKPATSSVAHQETTVTAKAPAK